MWQLLGSVVSTFLLLRDLFGYLIPGFVMVGTAAWAGRLDREMAALSKLPVWAAAIVAGVACYVVGHLLVALGYSIYSLVERAKGKGPLNPADAVDVMYYRYLYPPLFHDADRRGVINILRIGLAVALLATCPIVDHWLRWIALAGGLLMLWNGYTGKNHVAAERVVALDAAKRAAENKLPHFKWDGSSSKVKQDAENKK